MTDTDPRRPSHGLYAVTALVAAFFFCGTCNSCDAPAPDDSLPVAVVSVQP